LEHNSIKKTAINMSTAGGAPIHKDQLKAKYIGTGDADMTKFEWVSNMHRDTMASHVGHYDQMSYYAVAQNESLGRVKREFLEKMLEPCGKPPLGAKEEAYEKILNN
jgi:splicing factor 3B subunit 5